LLKRLQDVGSVKEEIQAHENNRKTSSFLIVIRAWSFVEVSCELIEVGLRERLEHDNVKRLKGIG
jgi:hypothetical protein